ncbi:hypothetical protein C8A03DRAFT_31740 [Achaetomium macrosporum]|uniref:Fungal specific transcription factor n=1 Tax=Achaetomium macrosporum TaxID=79813 RepID=A0AAN7CDR0_9PEZI|nr:hypothetical protein C8A03DRAFT_31740 [Achaetomium macrosporum]
MPGGLADSRHAPHARRPFRNTTTSTSLSPPTLTVTPAPITGHCHNNISHPPAASTTTANGTSAPDHPQRPPPSAPHELARYTKIIRRLQWKLPFLAEGYRKAVDRVGTDLAAVSEAELMFKLDFFEYYMLIERALVHLLGVFGVDIPRGYSSPSPPHNLPNEDGYGGTARRNGSKGLNGSIWRSESRARHRYHANVLAALDREDNPLHGTLGTGEVRTQLGRAKHLRNRWKTAGDELDHEHGDYDNGSSAMAARTELGEWPRSRKIAAPLDTYRLEYMLEVIFRGFEEAFKIAERYVKGGSERGAEGDADMLGEDGKAIDWTATADDDEDQWEFMVDAMDWEAV